MRLNRVTLKNFKNFTKYENELHPHLNILRGPEGIGKTTLLEALTIATGPWFQGLRDQDSREISKEDVRQTCYGTLGLSQYPCEIETAGEVNGKDLEWKRSLISGGERISTGQAGDLKDMAARADTEAREGKPTVLPLISYYSLKNLKEAPLGQTDITCVGQLRTRLELSRLRPYSQSLALKATSLIPDLAEWFARRTWIAFQKQGKYDSSFVEVRQTLIQNIPGSKDIYFEPGTGKVIVAFGDGTTQALPEIKESLLIKISLIGDLARKCITLNPYLGREALKESPGIVMIDDLDVLYSPEEQKDLVQSLVTVFPSLQFVVTSKNFPFNGEGLGLDGKFIALGEGDITIKEM